VYIEIYGFLGVYIAKFSEKAKTFICYRNGLKYVNVFGPFRDIYYIYPMQHKNFYIHPPIKKLVVLNYMLEKLLYKKLVIFFWSLCS